MNPEVLLPTDVIHDQSDAMGTNLNSRTSDSWENENVNISIPELLPLKVSLAIQGFKVGNKFTDKLRTKGEDCTYYKLLWSLDFKAE